MHIRLATCSLATVAHMVACGPASAEDFESRTTSIAEKSCKTVSRLRIGNSQLSAARVCRGVGGLVVLVSKDDLREVTKQIKAMADAGPLSMDTLDKVLRDWVVA